MELPKFAVEILRQYAHEKQVPPRSTSDLSPLEQWLIIQLRNNILPLSDPPQKDITRGFTETYREDVEKKLDYRDRDYFQAGVEFYKQWLYENHFKND